MGKDRKRILSWYLNGLLIFITIADHNRPLCYHSWDWTVTLHSVEKRVIPAFAQLCSHRYFAFKCNAVHKTDCSIDAYETEEGRIFTVLDSWVRNNDSVPEPSRVSTKFLFFPFSRSYNQKRSPTDTMV